MSDDAPTADIGVAARRLDAQSLVNRVRLEDESVRRIGAALAVYVVALVGLAWYAPQFSPGRPDPISTFVPVVVLSAFLFETLDSAAGMGLGASLGSLLFVLGYDPLAVTPVLLLSEAATGVVSGVFHTEFKNVTFGFGDESSREATKALGIIVVTGVAAVVVSVVMTYLAIAIPSAFIKAYVGVVILLIALTTLVQEYVQPSFTYRPRRLVAFAALAGLNKGIAGSGYGPVITLGEILSGVYEKSATAITSMAEGIVSIAGIVTFFGLSAAGVQVNLILLPSVFAGGFLAAILAPYTVRVLPNRILRFFVPGYALVLAGILFVKLAA